MLALEVVSESVIRLVDQPCYMIGGMARAADQKFVFRDIYHGWPSLVRVAKPFVLRGAVKAAELISPSIWRRSRDHADAPINALGKLPHRCLRRVNDMVRALSHHEVDLVGALEQPKVCPVDHDQLFLGVAVA